MNKKLSPKELKDFDRKNPEARADLEAMFAYSEGAPLPSRLTVTRVPYPPSPKEMLMVRKKLNMSQAQMANLLNTPKKTYQNWEQGLRVPMGAVALLFRLLSKKPAMIKELMAI